MPALASDFIHRAAEILQTRMVSINVREAVLAEAFQLAAPDLHMLLDVSGAPHDFALQTVRQLINHGCLEDGRHALEALFVSVRSRYGVGGQEEIDRLIDEVAVLCDGGRKWESEYLTRFAGLLNTLGAVGSAPPRLPERGLLVGKGAVAALAAAGREAHDTAATDTTAPLPVWIDLSGWKDGRSTLRSLAVLAMGESDSRVKRMLDQARLVLLLVNFDKMPDKKRRQTIQDFLIDNGSLRVLIAGESDDADTLKDVERVYIS